MSLAKVKNKVETACMKQFNQVLHQVEFINESSMLGLSPQSRKDLVMAG